MSNDRPFGSIENTQEFLSILSERIDEIAAEVQQEIQECSVPQESKRAQAWQVVLYTMKKLSTHISDSRKLMNDLNTMRNLMETDLEQMTG
jgi:hypothetical protein